MSIRSRSVKNSKIRGVVRHNTDGFPILSIHSNRRGRFGWVQPSLCSFLIGFECSERKSRFSHLGNTKKSAFSAFFETSAPRSGLAMLQINQEHAKFVFLDGCFNCSSNYAVRGLDPKIIQLRGSGNFGDWIKKCIQVLKRPCVFANALTRDNV